MFFLLRCPGNLQITVYVAIRFQANHFYQALVIAIVYKSDIFGRLSAIIMELSLPNIITLVDNIMELNLPKLSLLLTTAITSVW